MSLYESRANKLLCFDALAAGASSGFYTGRDQSRSGFQYYSQASKLEFNFVLHSVNYAKKNSTMNWCNSCTRWIQLRFFIISCHENYLFRRSIKVEIAGSWSSAVLRDRLEWSCRCFCVTTVTAIFWGAQSGATDDIAGVVRPHACLIKGASGVPVFFFWGIIVRILLFKKPWSPIKRKTGGVFSFKIA
jgi:hypothetical protein